MLNQVILVGRLVREPEVKETENGSKVSNITLAIPRPYKNEKGEYDTDFVDIVLWNGIASNTAEYCTKGDILGIRGRVQEGKDQDGKSKINVVAEKITFLQSKSKDKEQEVER